MFAKESETTVRSWWGHYWNTFHITCPLWEESPSVISGSPLKRKPCRSSVDSTYKGRPCDSPHQWSVMLNHYVFFVINPDLCIYIWKMFSDCLQFTTINTAEQRVDLSVTFLHHDTHIMSLWYHGASIHNAVECLTSRSREVSKLWELLPRCLSNFRAIQSL